MASKGTGKFVAQRTSALFLIPLTIWFLIGLISQAGASHVAAKLWLTQPINAVLITILVVVGAFHMRIGMSEVIEDYIHGKVMRGLVTLLNWAFALGVAAIAAWSVLSLAFG